MLAFEFEAFAENGMIRIPDKYAPMVRREDELKIIVLKKENSNISPERKNSNIKKFLKQIREKKIFHDINDPVEWQNQIRNEWP